MKHLIFVFDDDKFKNKEDDSLIFKYEDNNSFFRNGDIIEYKGSLYEVSGCIRYYSEISNSKIIIHIFAKFFHKLNNKE